MRTKLKLEDLQVESFETLGSVVEQRGTVRGHESDQDGVCQSGRNTCLGCTTYGTEGPYNTCDYHTCESPCEWSAPMQYCAPTEGVPTNCCTDPIRCLM